MPTTTTTTTNTTNTAAPPWLLVAPELKKDVVFFATIGMLCGFIQFFGYNYAKKSEFGSELLQEHIAFHSLMLMTMFVLLGRGIQLWRSKRGQQRNSPFIDHVAARAVAFASVAACVIFGFAISAGLVNAIGPAIKFVQAALFFVAIAEAVASPLTREGQSRLYWLALGMVIVTPSSF
ncbi:hypothetical protein [Rugamonas violacea]